MAKPHRTRLASTSPAACGHAAGGSVGADDEVGMDLLARLQPVAVDPPRRLQRRPRPAPGQCGRPGLEGGVVQHGVEDRPGDRRAVPGIGQAVARWACAPGAPSVRRPACRPRGARPGPAGRGRPGAGGPGGRPCRRTPCRGGRTPCPPAPPAPRPGPGPGRPRCPPGRFRSPVRQTAFDARCSFRIAGPTVRSFHRRREHVVVRR